eukprot:6834540-Prymnesium_polylepis.2
MPVVTALFSDAVLSCAAATQCCSGWTAPQTRWFVRACTLSDTSRNCDCGGEMSEKTLMSTELTKGTALSRSPVASTVSWKTSSPLPPPLAIADASVIDDDIGRCSQDGSLAAFATLQVAGATVNLPATISTESIAIGTRHPSRSSYGASVAFATAGLMIVPGGQMQYRLVRPATGVPFAGLGSHAAAVVHTPYAVFPSSRRVV